MSRNRKKRSKTQGMGLPNGAVPADQTQQTPNNSYGLPPSYYVDIPFTCRDCGSEEVWTAEQQKWYYEVAKGPLHATAVRCRDCRRRRNDAREAQRRRMADLQQQRDAEQ